MPEVRYYIAVQEREVRLWANSTGEAAQLANGIFKKELTTDLAEGHMVSPIRERSLMVRED